MRRPIKDFGFPYGVSEFELDRKTPGAPGAPAARSTAHIVRLRSFAGVWEFEKIEVLEPSLV